MVSGRGLPHPCLVCCAFFPDLAALGEHVEAVHGAAAHEEAKAALASRMLGVAPRDSAVYPMLELLARPRHDVPGEERWVENFRALRKALHRPGGRTALRALFAAYPAEFERYLAMAERIEPDLVAPLRALHASSVPRVGRHSARRAR